MRIFVWPYLYYFLVDIDGFPLPSKLNKMHLRRLFTKNIFTGLDNASSVPDDEESETELENFALPSDSLTARQFSLCIVKAKYNPPIAIEGMYVVGCHHSPICSLLILLSLLLFDPFTA